MDELDPAQRIQLDALSEEYYRRHGVAVDYLKAEVGAGEVYTNSVARAVISSRGAWCECHDMPMEFTGLAGGPVGHRFVSSETAQAVLGRLHSLIEQVAPDNTRRFSLMVLYTRAGIVDSRGVYAFHYTRPLEEGPHRPQVVGEYRPGVMPLFFRCRLDTDLRAPELPFPRGALFCLADVGERNLLVELPYEGEDLRDLSQMPASPTPQ